MYDIKISNITTALFLFIGIAFLSLLPSNIIRNWVYSSVFKNFSSGRIKEIKKERAIWQKISLWYLIEYSSNLTAKKHIISYWVYWIVVFIVASAFALSSLGAIPHLVTGFLLFPLLVFDVIIWFAWIKKGKKIF